jgi:hypothetical protein
MITSANRYTCTFGINNEDSNQWPPRWEKGIITNAPWRPVLGISNSEVYRFPMMVQQNTCLLLYFCTLYIVPVSLATAFRKFAPVFELRSPTETTLNLILSSDTEDRVSFWNVVVQTGTMDEVQNIRYQNSDFPSSIHFASSFQFRGAVIPINSPNCQQTADEFILLSRIWGSHGGEYEDGCLLGCSAV